MSLQTHLAELERKHRQLEEAIAQAVASPSSDDLNVAELKRKKLLLKDEIERVRLTMPSPTLH
ncbi:YdcH family protein [Bosea sp. NPDC055332]